MKLFNATKLTALVSAVVLMLGAFVLPVSAEDGWNDGILDWGNCEGNHVYTDDADVTCDVCLRPRLLLVTAPKTTYAKDGATATVTVDVKGFDDLTYTWYYKNASSKSYSKSSVTTNTYSVKMTSSVNGRSVYCVVTDLWGNELTTDAVKVIRQATITKEPATTAYAKKGAKASVKVTAVGDSLTYTWYYKNSGSSKYSKSSVKTATYSTTMSSSVKGRQVYCVVKDKYGKSVQSKTVTLREAASITKEPSAAVYAKKGAKASIKITASGDGLKYTWYVKNASASKYIKSSITSSTYSIKMSSTVKNRKVYCIVKDKYGKTVQSKTFVLRQSATITTQPKTVTVKKNATAKVSIKASGDGLKYTWYIKKPGTSKYVKVSTKSSYSVKMTSKVKGAYLYCVVKDKYGKSVKSSTVRIKMK